jgi:hypothetical protein
MLIFDLLDSSLFHLPGLPPAKWTLQGYVIAILISIEATFQIAVHLFFSLGQPRQQGRHCLRQVVLWISRSVNAN